MSEITFVNMCSLIISILLNTKEKIILPVWKFLTLALLFLLVLTINTLKPNAWAKNEENSVFQLFFRYLIFPYRYLQKF